MSLINFIKESLPEIKADGSDHFEYIGVNISDGSISNKKIYYRPCLLSGSTNIFPQGQSIYKELLKTNPNISICDYSQSNYNKQVSKRVVFTVPCDISYDECCRIISTFFNTVGFNNVQIQLLDELDAIKSIIDMSYSPLMQLGVECSNSGGYLAVKYYISIKDKLCQLNAYGKPQQQVIRNLLQANTIDINKNIEKICSNEFSPIFIGVNSDGMLFEHKLYFIHRYMNRDYDLTNKMKKLINDLGIKNVISTDDVISIIDMGLYIEGIAVSINNYNSIRLYFNRIPGQRRKKGHEM